MWGNTLNPHAAAFNFQGQPLAPPPPPPTSPYPNSLLLTELHTYFPALLYDPNRFVTTHSVLQYIIGQARAHYDVHSAWTNYYQNLQRQQAQQRRTEQELQRSLAQNRRAAAWHSARVPGVATRTMPVRPATAVPTNVTTTPPTTTGYENALHVLRTYLATEALLNDPVTQLMVRTIPPGAVNQGVRISADFMDPVPIIPSQQQLADASVVQTALTQFERPCAICQDEIAQGSTVRILNYCNHSFHQNCIDTWFHRNVHCPVCRHDVRILPPPAPTVAEPPSTDLNEL